MNLLRTGFNFLLYSNIFIGLGAVGLACSNQLTVGNTFSFDNNSWFIFFSTVFTYSYLKYGHPSTGVVTTAHRQWAKAYPQLSKNLLLLSLLASGAFFFTLSNSNKMIVMGVGVFTAFYGFVSLPFTSSKLKLRDFGLLKTFFVGLVWSVTTVIVPLEGTPVEPAMLVFLLLRRFLFIFALTLVFEIKDQATDREYNLRTLAMVLGISRTKLFAQLTLMLLVVTNLVQYFFYEISLSNMLAVNFSLLISMAVIQPVSEETTEPWYYFAIDGMMILQFVFVWLATQV